MFPFFTAILEEYHKTLSKLPKQCPALPGKYYVENVTVIEDNSIRSYDKILSSVTTRELPNGIYRAIVNFHAELILSATFSCNVEVYNKMNEDKF